MRICVKVSSLSFKIKFRVKSCGMFEVFEGCRSRTKSLDQKEGLYLLCGCVVEGRVVDERSKGEVKRKKQIYFNTLRRPNLISEAQSFGEAKVGKV